jgi:hypothetical protein
MKVYRTNDYSIFKTVKGNREVDKSNVKRLVKSLQLINLLEENPIIVNDRMEVIDGQHRLEAAQLLSLSIYYIVRRSARLPEVQLLNSNSKSWTLHDYLKSHIKRGNTSYVVIQDYCDKYGLPLSLGLELLSNKEDARRKIESLKDGTFEIGNLKKAERIGDIISEYKPYTENGVYRSQEFVRAVKRLLKGDVYNHNVMLKKLTHMKGLIRREASAKYYLRALEDIYNYKQRNLVRFT